MTYQSADIVDQETVLMSGRNYRYKTLPDNSIRLVELEPDRLGSSTLQIKLLDTRLDAPVRYEALSYVWGQPARSRTVICEGNSISVTDNLFDALQALRLHNKPRRLWIDAICIDQQDNKERQTQVQYMPHIFRQASQAIFWIGTENLLTGEAFQLLSRLVLARQKVFRDPLSHPPQQVSKTRTLDEYRRRLPSPSSVGWKGVDEMLSRVFFDRVWIVQDIISSQKATLHCGPREISWADFCYGLEGYAFYSYPNFLKSSSLQAVISVEKLRRRCLEGKPHSLGLDGLLDLTRNLQATRATDKINAARSILASVMPGMASVLEVDYSEPDERVYLRAAEVLNNIKFVPLFSSLAMAEDLESRRLNERPEFGSWIPEWLNQGHIYRLNCIDSSFFASKGREMGDLKFSGGKEFCFKGCKVDRVDQVANYLPPRRLCDKYNVSGANSFFFSEWFEWAEAKGKDRYEKDKQMLLLHWVETIQAKGCDIWQSREPLDPSTLLIQARAWLKYLESEDEEETEEIRQLYAACLPSHGRRFGISVRGKFCLLPRSAAVNDLICIPFGSKVPFIFRKEEGYYLNVGECYVHGAMHGDALKWESIEEAEFNLR